MRGASCRSPILPASSKSTAWLESKLWQFDSCTVISRPATVTTADVPSAPHERRLASSQIVRCGSFFLSPSGVGTQSWLAALAIAQTTRGGEAKSASLGAPCFADVGGAYPNAALCLRSLPKE
eukprot:scaffold83307_cov47-Phaeocystis_antarctica.AAC.2